MQTPAPPARGRPALSRALVFAVVAAMVTVLSATAATAQVHDAVSGISLQVDGQRVAQSVALEGVYPGSRHEAVVFLDGPRTSTVDTVAFEVTHVRDFENTCNRAEGNTIDDTCGSGPDQGELSDFLELSLAPGIERLVAGARGCELETAAGEGEALREITDLVVERPAAAVDGDVMCLVATFHHVVKGPIDNLTQTDSVLFDVELRFEGDDPSDGGGSVPDVTDVGGDSTDRGLPRTVVPSAVVPGGGTLGLGLAATGTPVLVLLGFALGLVGTGVLVRTLARGDAA